MLLYKAVATPKPAVFYQSVDRTFRAWLRTLPLSQSDRMRVRDAYMFAREKHYGVRRKSGDPYLIHPLEIAIEVSKAKGDDPELLMAILLHDVVED